MKHIYLLLAITIIYCSNGLFAQYSSKKINNIHQAYTDSIKNIKYTKIFPIWGQKVYEKGFDIPYPIGIMANYFYAKQGLVIDNLQLGLVTDNIDAPLTPIDFVGFGNNYTTAETYMVRPDVWIFPFLNVYGIFGGGNSTTEVNLDQLGDKPFGMQSIVNQSIKTAGVGMTGAAGLGPVWLAVDANMTWTKAQLVENPVKVSTLGVRFGHNFVFQSKPYRNIGLWAGAMAVKMGSSTVGEIKLSEVLPPVSAKKKQEVTDNYNDWYNDPATPIAQKIAANEVIKPLVDALGNSDSETIIKYGIDKSVKQPWNGLIGGQYQHNKSWMLRSEVGFIGNRKSFLLSLNYRFK